MIVRNKRLCLLARARAHTLVLTLCHWVIIAVRVLSHPAWCASSSYRLQAKMEKFVSPAKAHRRLKCDAREILVDDYIDVNHHQPSIINRFVCVCVRGI